MNEFTLVITLIVIFILLFGIGLLNIIINNNPNDILDKEYTRLKSLCDSSKSLSDIYLQNQMFDSYQH